MAEQDRAYVATLAADKQKVHLFGMILLEDVNKKLIVLHVRVCW